MKVLTVFLSMKGETIAPGMKTVNLEKGYNQGKAAAFFDNYLKENPQ